VDPKVESKIYGSLAYFIQKVKYTPSAEFPVSSALLEFGARCCKTIADISSNSGRYIKLLTERNEVRVKIYARLTADVELTESSALSQLWLKNESPVLLDRPIKISPKKLINLRQRFSRVDTLVSAGVA